MGLLVIGFAVGIVVALLLRTLLQYERDGLARVGDSVAELEETMDRLQKRVEALETIATTDEPVPASPVDRAESTDSFTSERRVRS